MTDDEFDIDIYGDTNTEQEVPVKKDEEGDVDIDGLGGSATEDVKPAESKAEDEEEEDYVDIKLGTTDQDHSHDHNSGPADHQQRIKTNEESDLAHLSIPKQAPQQQGVKRKEGSDDRPVDPGATTALLISELHWWNTDDDIRGWVNQAQVEDELIDISFSEHKVNGKSKGLVSLLISFSMSTSFVPMANLDVTDKLMLSSHRNRLQQLPSTKLTPLEKVRSTSRSMLLPTRIQMSTHSVLCRRTYLNVLLKMSQRHGQMREATAMIVGIRTALEGISEATSAVARPATTKIAEI